MITIHRTVYLIISDLHSSYKNKESRKDYIGEVTHVINQILAIGTNYKRKGYTVILLFLGDIVDNSYKDMSKAVLLNNIFVHFRDIFDGTFSVIGNHEFSFYKDNPFWTLVQQINSNKIKEVLNRTWQPQGLFNLVNIVDKLEDGNVVFHFNHHATSINQPEIGKTNIGLFHKDITSKAIINDMHNNLDLDIFESNPIYFDKTNVLYGYDIAFFGHMHKLYGKWKYIDDVTNYETSLYYLASLVRPNHTEIQNNFLERNIPAVIVEDGNFVEVQDNKFQLQSREECVIENVIELKKDLYEQKKEEKSYIDYLPKSDNPIDNLQSTFAGNRLLTILFDSYLKEDVITYEHDLSNRLEELDYL